MTLPCHDFGSRQRFSWVNAIVYGFSQHRRRQLSLHVVVYEETWGVVDEQGDTLTKGPHATPCPDQASHAPPV